MFEPIRGGTRGGQAEFKWTDVSADKDREHYLGHSINAPTGRWQKNKDVHWYNRDLGGQEEERYEEIKKVKEAEAEALSVALGFAPTDKTQASGGPITSPVSPVIDRPVHVDLLSEAKALEKEERRRKKAERKEEKKAQKEKRRAERRERRMNYGDDDSPRKARRSRSPSPFRRPREEHVHHNEAPPRRGRSPSPSRRSGGVEYDRDKAPPRARSRSRSPYRVRRPGRGERVSPDSSPRHRRGRSRSPSPAPYSRRSERGYNDRGPPPRRGPSRSRSRQRRFLDRSSRSRSPYSRSRSPPIRRRRSHSREPGPRHSIERERERDRDRDRDRDRWDLISRR